MVSPRTATLVSLAALPAVGYYTLTDDLRVAISVLNVLLIASALYIAFSPIDSDSHAQSHDS